MAALPAGFPSPDPTSLSSRGLESPPGHCDPQPRTSPRTASPHPPHQGGKRKECSKVNKSEGHAKAWGVRWSWRGDSQALETHGSWDGDSASEPALGKEDRRTGGGTPLPRWGTEASASSAWSQGRLRTGSGPVDGQPGGVRFLPGNSAQRFSRGQARTVWSPADVAVCPPLASSQRLAVLGSAHLGRTGNSAGGGQAAEGDLGARPGAHATAAAAA